MYLYLDLDGVFADFDRAVFDRFGYWPNEDNKKQMWEDIRKWEVDNLWGWFESLPRTDDCFRLWDECRQWNPIFLTATGNDYEDVTRQKIRWVRSMFGKYPVITVKKTQHKALYAASNAVLVDDRMKAIGPWRDAGGIGVLHDNAEETIRQLRVIFWSQGEEE